MVFDEDLGDFAVAFQEVFAKFKDLKASKSDGKAYSIEEKRQSHKHAHSHWTEDDDSKLELLFCEGKTITELSQIFERNEGAITSRIGKLELNEKYQNYTNPS
jgi:hypothetical protein